MGLLVSTYSQAAQVRHLFDYTTSQLSLETAGACGSIDFHVDSIRCNPALQRTLSKNMGTFEITTLADEATFDSLWKFASQPLTANDVKTLFEKYNFGTFSGYVRLATASKWASFELVPASLVGAYRLSNPSLPFLQVSGVRKSAFSTSLSMGLRDFYDDSPIGIDVGVKLKSERLTLVNAEIDALTAASKTEKTAVSSKKRNELDADMGLYLDLSKFWLPSFGLVCANCLKNEVEDDSFDLQTTSNELRSIKGHLSIDASPGVGTVFVSSILSWGSDFNTFETETSGASLGYLIGDFFVSTQYTPSRTGWGFIAKRGFYQIGMQYAREKQPPLFQIERQEKLYMTLGAAL
jgi:hypothetical protein